MPEYLEFSLDDDDDLFASLNLTEEQIPSLENFADYPQVVHSDRFVPLCVCYSNDMK